MEFIFMDYLKYNYTLKVIFLLTFFIGIIYIVAMTKKSNAEFNRKFNTQVIKYNIKMDGFPTSITLRKDVVSLWVLLTDNIDANGKEMIEDFIYEKVLPIWKKSHGRGLSEFISKCMFRSVLSRRDYSMYKKIHKNL